MWIATLRPRRHRADRNSPWTAGLCGADTVPFFSLSSSPLVPHMAESDQGILWPAPDQQFNIVRDGAWMRLVAGSGLTRCSGLKSDDANLVFPLSADLAGSFISVLSRGACGDHGNGAAWIKLWDCPRRALPKVLTSSLDQSLRPSPELPIVPSIRKDIHTYLSGARSQHHPPPTHPPRRWLSAPTENCHHGPHIPADEAGAGHDPGSPGARREDHIHLLQEHAARPPGA